MSKMKARSANRKIGKSINRLIGCYLVGAMVLTAQAETLTWDSKQTYTTATTIDDDIVLVGEVEVSSSKTLTLNGKVSGDGMIKTTGAGTIVFANGENSFALNGQSIRVEKGVVRADAEGAFSTGKLTVASAKSGNTAQLYFNAAGATFANDIDVTGYLSEVALYFGQSATLSGKVDAQGMTALRINYLSNGTTRLGKTGTFTGEVDVGSGELGIYTIEDTVFNGKVTCGTLYLNKTGYSSGGEGSVTLGNTNNSIGLISMLGSSLKMTADKVLGGARYYVRGRKTGTKYTQLYLNGYSQSVKALDMADSVTFTDTQTDCKISTDKNTETTLTITGDSESAVTRSYSSSYQVALIVDVDTATYPNFVQTLEGRSCGGWLSNKPLKVNAGKLRLDAGWWLSSTANTRIVIEESGELQLAAVTNAFPNVIQVNVNGKLNIGDAANQPFTDNAVTMTLGANAEITIPADMTITLNSLTVDGVKQYKGFYDKSNLSQIKGDGKIYTDGDTPTVVEKTWTAGGSANTSISEGANWGGTAPKLTGYMLDATFATAGTAALIDTKVEFDKLTFDAPNGFSLLQGDNGSVSIGANGLVVAAKASEEDSDLDYLIEPELSIYDTQSWIIPGGRTLAFGNGFSNAGGAFVNVGGGGELVWRGTNTLAATFAITNTTLRVETGMVASVNHAWEGDPKTEASTLVMEFYATSSKSAVELADAVIEKTMRFNSTKSDVPIVVSKAGTTNEVTGFIRQTSNGYSGFMVETNSVLTLSGGYMNSNSLTKKYGKGTLRIARRSFGACGGSMGFNFEEGKLVFDGTSDGMNVWLPIGTKAGGDSEVEFNVNNAAKNARFSLGKYVNNNTLYNQTSGSSVAEFHSTTQAFQQVVAGARAVMHGDEDSCLVVIGNQSNTKEISAPSIQGDITGSLSLLMGGTGTLTLKGSDFATTGDLVVTNGTLEIAADANWTNGVNVVVAQNGALKLNAKANLGATTTRLSVSDSGTVEIAEGTTVAVAEAYHDGTKLDDGNHTSATDSWITSGTLKVGKLGTTIMLW